MEDLPPLPSSRSSSRAPSGQSSSPELNESHLYIRDFVRETRQRLNFTAVQLPILDDHQLSSLSDGETILVPLSCSTLNTLGSMTRQLDTITTQLGNIQQAVHSMPTWRALQGTLEPINAAIRDLSHRVTAPTPHAPAPTRPPMPPTDANTRQAPTHTRPPVPPTGATTLGLLFPRPVLPHCLPSSPKRVFPPPARALHPPSTQTYQGMMWTPGLSMATHGRTRLSSLIHGKQTLSERGNTLTPPPLLPVTLPLTAPNPSERMPRPPRLAFPEARRIRAPLRPPKSRQPATVCLPRSHPSRSPRPKEDSTLLVLPPPNTNKRP